MASNDYVPSPQFFDTIEGAGSPPVAANLVATRPNNSSPRGLFHAAAAPENADADNDGNDNNNNDNDTPAGSVINNNDPGTPGYIQRLLNRAECLNMDDVQEEEKETGDGDSTGSADDVNPIDDAMSEAQTDRLQVLIKLEDDGEESAIMDSENKCLFVLTGLEPEISVPEPPDDWVPDAPKTDRNEPLFAVVDNPGLWSQFTFRPKFAKKTSKEAGAYAHHTLPTGCRPVPPNEGGERTQNGWAFHYNAWNAEPTEFVARSGVTKTNMFPDSRKGKLDYDLLKRMGLSKKRILGNDCLFFYQLLFPLCDPKKSGIGDDPRLPFYSVIEKWSQKYAVDLGMPGSYGHDCKAIMSDELVHFDMALIRDGIHGGSNGAIYCRWKQGTPTYDRDITEALTHTRFLQLKRMYKLCDNDKSPKKDQPGYDPAYKYDYIYKVLIHNVNEITETADLDLCGDETTWAHMGYGEAGTSILCRIMGKPGVTKGGQTVINCQRRPQEQAPGVSPSP